MQRQEKAKKDSKEFRPAAMARPRRAERSYNFRRRSLSVHAGQMAIPMDAEEVSLARHLWDEHAVKGGMVVFWGWFAMANWHNVQQLVSPLFG